MSSTQREEWLLGLAEGDLVVVTGGVSYADRELHIARVTKTQIILEGPRGINKFSRRSGFMSGSRGLFLVEATPERLAKLRHHDLTDRLRSVDWPRRSLEDLQRIWAAVEA